MSARTKRRRAQSSGLRLVKRAESPFYQIVGAVRGVPVRKSTGTDRYEAAEAIRVKTENELLFKDLTGTKGPSTFDRAWELYIGQRPEQKTRSVQLLLLHFKDTSIPDITDEAVLAFSKKFFPKAKPASVNRLVYTPLIAILHLAHKNRMCDAPTLTRLPTKRVIVKAAPEAWVKSFLAGCDNARLKAMVMLMTTTAVRVQEACRVTWNDVNFARAEILIEVTKSDDPRVLPLGKNVVELLKAIRAASPDDPAGKRVFGLSGRGSVRQALERQCERLGLPYYSSHKLGRHAFAERMLAKGHTLGEVIEAGGWSKASLPMMFRVYGHLERKRTAEAVRAMAEEMEAA